MAGDPGAVRRRGADRVPRRARDPRRRGGHGRHLSSQPAPAAAGRPWSSSRPARTRRAAGRARPRRATWPPRSSAPRALFDLDADPAAIAATLGADPLLAPAGRGRAGAPRPGQRRRRRARGAGGARPAGVARRRDHARRPARRRVRRAARAPVGVGHPPVPDRGRARRGRPRATSRCRGRAAARCSACAMRSPRGARPRPRRATAGAARERLLALPGIGPWTAEYVAMRALGDRDAFMPSDLGMRRALERLGERRPARAAVERLAERWRPYRAYAVQHLWAVWRLAAQPSSW